MEQDLFGSLHLHLDEKIIHEVKVVNEAKSGVLKALYNLLSDI